MKFIPELGIAAPELGWVPSPTFVLRRQAITDRVRTWPPGLVLEMGCGAGAILYDLAARGFEGFGVETAGKARDIARRILVDCHQFQIFDSVPDSVRDVDYLLSFEVLEHIEDDAKALTNWVERMRKGGTCLLSVPANSDHWNITDVLAGHYRRYDKKDLLNLLERCGLTPTYVSTIGWPATWLIEGIRNRVRWRQLERQEVSISNIEHGASEQTEKSGIERSTEVKLFPYYSSLPGRLSFRFMGKLQRRFYSSERGISFLVEAKKS